jgi:hypothetical protein
MTPDELGQWRFDHGVGPAPRSIPQTPGGIPAYLLRAGGSDLLTPQQARGMPEAEGRPSRPARLPESSKDQR